MWLETEPLALIYYWQTMRRIRTGQNSKKSSNQLRIIGGEWRGRKLVFPTVEGLRPTTDRVRETLFNWLGPALPGARCLDLFAGSGALGLEALSRGASHVDFIDSSTAAVHQLNDNFRVLSTDKAASKHSEALTWLNEHGPRQMSYDIIFLDPPFRQHMLSDVINAIDAKQLLSKNSWVYVETDKKEELPVLPGGWELYREKTAGYVCYRLFNTSG